MQQQRKDSLCFLSQEKNKKNNRTYRATMIYINVISHLPSF